MVLKKTDILNSSILMALAAVIFLRAPILLTAPRFYDEDGWYFKYAYDNSFIKSLLVVQTPRGYFEIFTNTAMALASAVPLRYAPTICAVMAFLAQLIPIAVVLWGRSFFFDNYLKKIVVTLIMIFVQSTGDIWIAVMQSQFFLLLSVFLILISEVEGESKSKKWAYHLLLLISGFAGVTSCFLTPVYILRAVTKKCREHTIHAVILIFASICQLTVEIYTYYTIGGFNGRFNNKDVFTIISFYFIENYLQPVFGYGLMLIMLKNTIFIVPVAVCLIWLIYKSILDVNRRLLVLGIVFSSIMLTLTSVNMTGAARYMFAPGVMLMVLVFSFVRFDGKSFLTASSIAAFALTVISLTTSMFEYRARMTIYVKNYWPNWKTEVAIWEKDPTHPIRIWPQLDFYKPEIKLNPKK
ncbi:hypothetical protein [Candidatus Magnetomonas plexicatena]|uniref:hypothetical protein n=1 Tax=Candidatus Magnetomonas plexicatena TaxID=2552947 RepID=UPI001C7677DD|nr:hypothetical protein E2O03_010000 [Nitrospirales bacterium LBB_01]